MPKRILVVDDDENILNLERTILEQKGFEVTTAGGGAEALQILAGHAFDLVLLDVMMPEVDGWEMLQRVQERHGVGSIPVIMFSGKVDERSLAEAADRGARGFIGKPFDPQQLIERAKALVPS